jgi:ABC-type branched-subunit amino acid transport system substrate-binding protein
MRSAYISRRTAGRQILATGLAFVAPLAQAEDGVTPRQILIGQNITLQAGKNDYGVAVSEGIAAFLGPVNLQGGINGRQIVLKTLDDDNNNTQAEANARALIEQHKAFILFGSIEGGPSTAVMKAAVDLKVPFFGPMAGSPTLRRPHQPLVFPVRAEHREEFRALLEYARQTGGSRAAFFRSDSEVGLQHLENVKLLCKELGMEMSLDLPFKSDTSDAQLDAYVQRLVEVNPHVVFNHGGISVYERLIRKAKVKIKRNIFCGVNSGSAQLAKHLGDLAPGMVFSQVVPSPWERKTAITREYRDAFAKAYPGKDYSYGSLEGYMTAKALVAALRQAGGNPTRASFVQGLYAAGGVDINGLKAVYQPGLHAGLSLVDLSIVSADGRFRH